MHIPNEAFRETLARNLFNQEFVHQNESYRNFK